MPTQAGIATLVPQGENSNSAAQWKSKNPGTRATPICRSSCRHVFRVSVQVPFLLSLSQDHHISSTIAMKKHNCFKYKSATHGPCCIAMVENRNPKGNYLLVSTIITYYIHIVGLAISRGSQTCFGTSRPPTDVRRSHSPWGQQSRQPPQCAVDPKPPPNPIVPPRVESDELAAGSIRICPAWGGIIGINFYNVFITSGRSPLKFMAPS